MKGWVLWLLLAAAGIAGCSYLCAENLLLSIGVFALYAIGFCFVLSPLARFYLDKQTRGHECYRFIHAFLISLSATSSLERSIASSSEGAQGKFAKTLEAIEHLEPLEKTRCLKDYFRSDIYKMFLSVLDLYLEQGGDILALSNSLLEEVNRVEEANRQKEKEGIKGLFQYALLWTMALGIMVFLRFGMSSFYSKIKANAIYLSCVGVFFLFMLSSFIVYGLCYAGRGGMKKWKKEEKEK